VKVWHGDRTIGGSPDDVESISWTANGQWLAFDWGTGTRSSTVVGTWLLDTRLIGHVADSGDGQVGIISGNTYAPPGLGANDFGGVW
jgi:hypothetical protein